MYLIFLNVDKRIIFVCHARSVVIAVCNSVEPFEYGLMLKLYFAEIIKKFSEITRV